MTNQESGFTLIEALVALALGVFVVMVVLSTVRIASVSATRAARAQSETEAFSQAASVMDGDAQHAVKLRDTAGDVIFSGQPQDVMFPAISRDTTAPDAVVALSYTLRSTSGGVDLLRAEAPLLDSGKPGIFEPAFTLWHGNGRLEFRFLDNAGEWQSQWSVQSGLPKAFGIAAPGGTEPQLVATFPDLIEAACSLGPSDACALPAEEFP